MHLGALRLHLLSGRENREAGENPARAQRCKGDYSY